MKNEDEEVLHLMSSLFEEIDILRGSQIDNVHGAANSMVEALEHQKREKAYVCAVARSDDMIIIILLD